MIKKEKVLIWKKNALRNSLPSGYFVWQFLYFDWNLLQLYITHFRIKLGSIRNLFRARVDISLLGGEPRQAPHNEKEANR